MITIDINPHGHLMLALRESVSAGLSHAIYQLGMVRSGQEVDVYEERALILQIHDLRKVRAAINAAVNASKVGA